MPHSRSGTPPLCVCGHGRAAWPSERRMGWNGRMGEGGEDERMQGEGRMRRCKTKCKVGEQMQGGGGGREGGETQGGVSSQNERQTRTVQGC